MVDLIQHLNVTRYTPHKPMGWDYFLHTLSEINLPLSMVPNKHARGQMQNYKDGGDPDVEFASPGSPTVWSALRKKRSGPSHPGDQDDDYSLNNKKKKKDFVSLSPRWVHVS